MTKSILVIDDEVAIRKSFLLALEDTDFHVAVAESGQKGLEMMEQNAVDLIFLDLKMPGMNGAQTLKKIRSIDPAVTVYIVTAFYGDYFEELQKMAKDGIDFEVLQKPVNSGQILMVTRGILEGPVGEDA